jgi:hypothetical protein
MNSEGSPLYRHSVACKGHVWWKHWEKWCIGDELLYHDNILANFAWYMCKFHYCSTTTPSLDLAMYLWFRFQNIWICQYSWKNWKLYTQSLPSSEMWHHAVCHPSTRLHSVTTQKSVIFVAITVRTSNNHGVKNMRLPNLLQTITE